MGATWHIWGMQGLYPENHTFEEQYTQLGAHYPNVSRKSHTCSSGLLLGNTNPNVSILFSFGSAGYGTQDLEHMWQVFYY
jgi:hypothetical protein